MHCLTDADVVAWSSCAIQYWQAMPMQLGSLDAVHVYMAPSIPATSDQLAPLGLLNVLLSVMVLQMLCILSEGQLT